MLIERIVPGLWRLAVLPPDIINAYVAGDVLIDSGGRFGGRRLVRALGEQTIRAHALTHAHFDHQGSSHFVCERLGIPLWCGAGDRSAIESGDLTPLLPRPTSSVARLGQMLGGPPHPVSRSLTDGEEVGGFTVVATPGHTPGHLSFWRARDRVLIVGDVIFHRNPVTLRKGLAEPFAFATFDPGLNRASARRLAALEPRIVCFGHGAVLAPGRQFCDYIAALPRD